MSHSSHETSHGGASHGSVKTYLIGFILSIILTVIPFAMVMSGTASHSTILAVVVGMAVIQVVVHLIYFLHMNTSSEERWNLVALLFTAMIIGIVVVGFTLDYVQPQHQYDGQLRVELHVMIKQYLQVTKPGIIFGNLISVVGGFLLASKGSIDYPLFLATLVGVSLVVASGCVFNNYIDRDIDKKMERTKNRVLVKGLIAPSVSLVYATALGIAGFALLYIGANPLAMWLAVMGFVVYVGVYSLYMKRHSVYGTLIGSLSGAAPPVIGYCAVTNEFDAGALILLAIFSLWQMPHSYAIAIFRFKDYQAANIPVLPVVKGISVAKNHITVYIVAFMVATLMLTLGGYAGYKYLIVAAAVSVWWLGMALRGYKAENDSVWARKLFVFSIVAITSLSVMMSIDFSASASPETLMTYVW
jgi:heme o synthase